MKAACIRICDFFPEAGTGQEIQRFLTSSPLSSLLIQHEPMGELSAPSGLMGGPEPDLFILILPSGAASRKQVLEVHQRAHDLGRTLAVLGVDDPVVVCELFREGVADYLVPPFRQVDVVPRVCRMIEFRRDQAGIAAPLRQAFGLQPLVGESPAFVAQVQNLPRLARCDASALISGETGVGKEICARAIHYLSARARQPFVPVNCGAIPVELMENELFGHAAGAFTGAQSACAGVIQEAAGGTLFLDEVDALSLKAQVKLLRFLQDKEYRPLGSQKACKADIRIIAASNGNWEQLIREGALRQDLYYRLNVLRVNLPPLRERKEDIPLLARHFLGQQRESLQIPGCDFTSGALQKMEQYDWPGNVRELENIVARAAVMCRGAMIEAGDIDLPAVAGLHGADSFRARKEKVVKEFELKYMQELLVRYEGNIGQAARAAKKNRRAFYALMCKHHLKVERPAPARPQGSPVHFVISMDKNVQPRTGL